MIVLNSCNEIERDKDYRVDHSDHREHQGEGRRVEDEERVGSRPYDAVGDSIASLSGE